MAAQTSLSTWVASAYLRGHTRQPRLKPQRALRGKLCAGGETAAQSARRRGSPGRRPELGFRAQTATTEESVEPPHANTSGHARPPRAGGGGAPGRFDRPFQRLQGSTDETLTFPTVGQSGLQSVYSDVAVTNASGFLAKDAKQHVTGCADIQYRNPRQSNLRPKPHITSRRDVSGKPN